jgi:hypothetical protein
MDDATKKSTFDCVRVFSHKGNLVIVNPDLPGRCHFCGRAGETVTYFTRRGYS